MDRIAYALRYVVVFMIQMPDRHTMDSMPTLPKCWHINDVFVYHMLWFCVKFIQSHVCYLSHLTVLGFLCLITYFITVNLITFNYMVMTLLSHFITLLSSLLILLVLVHVSKFNDHDTLMTFPLRLAWGCANFIAQRKIHCFLSIWTHHNLFVYP